MPRITNRQRVVDYLLVRGSITNQESADYIKPRIFSLSQEITRLEQEGYIFDHIRETGGGSHWTRYKLKIRPRNVEMVIPDIVKRGCVVSYYECPRGHKFMEYGDANSGRCPSCNWQIMGVRVGA